MQRLEVSGVVRLIYRSLGVKGLICVICIIVLGTHYVKCRVCRSQWLVPNLKQAKPIHDLILYSFQFQTAFIITTHSALLIAGVSIQHMRGVREC